MRVAVILAGLVAGVIALTLAEGLLRLLDVAPTSPSDPFAGFSSTVPLFEPARRSDGAAIYRASPARLLSPEGHIDEPQREFLATKLPGTFRVFVVGESSAAGFPYGTGYAFSSWLERRLTAELPDWHVEVVNAAMPGYSSRRQLVVVRELAAYAPDLLIVYSGHNELAERRFYAHLLDRDPRIFRLQELLVETRLYRLVSTLVPAPRARPSIPEFTVDDVRDIAQMFAVVDERVAGKVYPTPRELAYAEMLYRFDLVEMARVMRHAGARVMLLTLSQNFADWPPGASSHRPDLADDDLTRWNHYVAEGDALADRHDDCLHALERYAKALTIDDQFAALVYRVASCERRLGRFNEAYAHFRRASDLDRVPHGAPTSFNDDVRIVAQEEGALFVDVEKLLERESAYGLVGDDLFVDFCHPNLRAHQRIAQELVQQLQVAGVPVPAERWTPGRYVDPDSGSLYAADPTLRTKEHLARAATCMLARRDDCARAEVKHVLATDPDDRWARQMQQALGQRDVR